MAQSRANKTPICEETCNELQRVWKLSPWLLRIVSMEKIGIKLFCVQVETLNENWISIELAKYLTWRARHNINKDERSLIESPKLLHNIQHLYGVKERSWLDIIDRKHCVNQMSNFCEASLKWEMTWTGFEMVQICIKQPQEDGERKRKKKLNCLPRYIFELKVGEVLLVFLLSNEPSKLVDRKTKKVIWMVCMTSNKLLCCFVKSYIHVLRKEKWRVERNIGHWARRLEVLKLSSSIDLRFTFSFRRAAIHYDDGI